MTDERALLDDLHALLAREKAALRAADFGALATLVPAIEALSQRLSPMIAALDRHALDGLRHPLDEVNRLSLASLSGLSAAQDRLEALRRPGGDLKTYDAGGRIACVTTTIASVERRG